MKSIKTIVLSILMFYLLTMVSFADIGPKPSLTIEGRNMPEEMCYMDLLIEDSSHSHRNIENLERYDQRMIKILEEYNKEGFRTAMVHGSPIPIYGDIQCPVVNGQTIMEYSYSGIPDYFKIIVVSESGVVKVSKPIKRRAFQSTVYYDYETGIVSEKTLVIAYTFQFISTFVPTLIVEGLLLLLFRFSFKKNIKVFFLTNLLTQVVLTVIVYSTMILCGSLMGSLLYIPFEVVILAIESILFSIYLKGYTKVRRVIYAIVANLVSFTVGMFILLSSGLFTA